MQILAGTTWGVFTCVGWQVTLCDPIWQVTSRRSEMGFLWRAISAFFYLFTFLLILVVMLTSCCSWVLSISRGRMCCFLPSNYRQTDTDRQTDKQTNRQTDTGLDFWVWDCTIHDVTVSK